MTDLHLTYDAEDGLWMLSDAGAYLSISDPSLKRVIGNAEIAGAVDGCHFCGAKDNAHERGCPLGLLASLWIASQPDEGAP